MFETYFLVLLAVVIFLSTAVKILPEWERGVVLRFGRFVGTRGPGLIILVPWVEKIIKVDIRTITMDIKPQDVISKDNISLQVDAVVYFRVVNPEHAITKIENYYFATSQLAQTTMRSIVGQFQMDEILEHREKINLRLQEILDRATDPWGIKVSSVELKQIDLPSEMKRAMAREAEAERERRAKIISAEGELQRAQKLADASAMIANSPAAMQLAYLQALNEVASDKTNTIIFPLPLELLRPFLEKPEVQKS
jgi:regulator of protease activity HflC (stomatin/prohibitin superfamily)